MLKKKKEKLGLFVKIPIIRTEHVLHFLSSESLKINRTLTECNFFKINITTQHFTIRIKKHRVGINNYLAKILGNRS